MLHTVDIFRDLTFQEREEVLSGSRTITYLSNQIIYTPEDKWDSLSIVLKG